MKYLGAQSFQVGGYNRKYSENWDAIFGRNQPQSTGQDVTQTAPETSEHSTDASTVPAEAK